jgi:hypothetical protein
LQKGVQSEIRTQCVKFRPIGEERKQMRMANFVQKIGECVCRQDRRRQSGELLQNERKHRREQRGSSRLSRCEPELGSRARGGQVQIVLSQKAEEPVMLQRQTSRTTLPLHIPIRQSFLIGIESPADVVVALK